MVIWNKLFSIDNNDTWINLIVHRTLVNILTKMAILSTNEIKIPFYDQLMADLRRIRPPIEFFEQFSEIKNNLLKKKVFFRPTEFFEKFNFSDGLFAEMYLNESILFDTEFMDYQEDN